MSEEIDRSTCAAQLIARLTRPALRNKGGDSRATIAQRGEAIFIPMKLGAVKRAVHAGKFRIIEIRLIIPPQSVVIIAFDPRIKTTRCRRILFDDRIIAIGWIIPVRIKSAKKLIEVLIIKCRDKIAQTRLARIGRCRHSPAVIQTRPNIKGNAPFFECIVIAYAFTNRGFDLRDIKCVTGFHVDKTRNRLTASFNQDRLLTRRQELFHNKAAIFIDLCRFTHNACFVTRNITTIDPNGAATNQDI